MKHKCNTAMGGQQQDPKICLPLLSSFHCCQNVLTLFCRSANPRSSKALRTCSGLMVVFLSCVLTSFAEEETISTNSAIRGHQSGVQSRKPDLQASGSAQRVSKVHHLCSIQ